MRGRSILLAVLVSVGACGDDAIPSTAPTTAPATTLPEAATTAVTASPTTDPAPPAGGAALPPGELEPLAAFVDPLVAPLGYRVGRASLIDRITYRATPEGTHLALYLTPLIAKTPDEYAGDFVPIARILTPAIFDTWPGLMSFDVCQEPFAWEGATAPPGLTVFDIERDTAAGIDWPTVDLAGLLQTDRVSDGLDIYAQEPIRSSTIWSAAADT